MKPDYKNWVPAGLVYAVGAGAALSGILFLLFMFTELFSGTAKTVACVITGILFLIFVAYTAVMANLYITFSYNGKKQLSRRIIDKVSDYVVLPQNGRGLDVGCGSGALTIACARKNPQGFMTGVDRWGKEYASFNKPLCENNAKIEGADKNTEFVRGDATKLSFPDESFDAVTSNYCYHNIPVKDRTALILETLRVLKKGGSFVIHDEFTKSKYGDTDEMLKRIRQAGIEKVELLDTSDGLIMTKKEATPLFLVGSGLLIGRK